MIHEVFGLGIVATIPIVAFAKEIKERIRQEQNGRCDLCNIETNLEIHHKIPESRGGSSRRENGVGLCTRDHEQWDSISLTSNLAYPGVEYKPIKRRKGRKKRH